MFGDTSGDQDLSINPSVIDARWLAEAPLSNHSAPPTDLGRPYDVLSPMLPGDPDVKPELVDSGLPPREAKFQLAANMDDASPS